MYTSVSVIKMTKSVALTTSCVVNCSDRELPTQPLTEVTSGLPCVGGMRIVGGCLILLGCFGFATSRIPGLHYRVSELVKTSCTLPGSKSTSGPETKRLGTALVVSTPSFANELIEDKEDGTTRADGAVMLAPAVLEVRMTTTTKIVGSLVRVHVCVCVCVCVSGCG